MPLVAASSVSPLIVQTAPKHQVPDHVMIINPDGTITYEPNTRYQQPTIIRRTYREAAKPKLRYALEQEGQSYRCCQWCGHWCTRRCPSFDFCDRTLAYPLLFFILSGIFLFLLLIALLTLFGLHPNINSARRYYGLIRTLSIVNSTTYIYGMDTLCNKYAMTRNCFNITTSISVINLATTMTINGTRANNNYSGLSLLLLCFCVTMYCVYCRLSARIA